MRIGIGLPVAVPGAAHDKLGDWAAASERLGFCSVGSIDRLVYDNLDPLIGLAAAAARTVRIELVTTILNVVWRTNAVLLAKQLASVDQISSRRLTAGLGLGGWPEDYSASNVSLSGRGKLFDAMLSTMRRVWDGQLTGASGPIPAQPPGRPRLLLAGMAAASFRRVAAIGEGWVAPLISLEVVAPGIKAAREAWQTAGRSGACRVVIGRYFCLGPAADALADEYVDHYYTQQFFADVRKDTLTTSEHLRSELSRLRVAGCDDVLLYPCSHDLAQVDLLAAALDSIGIPSLPDEGRVLHGG